MKAAEFFQRNAEGVDKWIANKEFSYEASVVKVLLKHFNLLWKQSDLEQACQDSTGERRLTLAWFRNAYPSFPIALKAKDIQGVSEMALHEAHGVIRKGDVLVDKFFTSKIFKAYEDLLEDFYLDADLIGLIFRCRGVSHYILHNQSRPSIDLPGTRLCKSRFQEKGSAPIETYTIEPLQQYLVELSGRWNP